jgi:hypothetical protein
LKREARGNAFDEVDCDSAGAGGIAYRSSFRRSNRVKPWSRNGRRIFGNLNSLDPLGLGIDLCEADLMSLAQ